MAQIKRRKTKDGRVRYQVLRYVRGEDGEYRQRSIGTVSTLKEAKRLSSAAQLEGTPRDSKGETVDSLLSRWLDLKSISLEPTTLDVYISNAQIWRQLEVGGRRWGDLRVDRVTTEDVNQALSILGKPRAPQTLRNVRSVMKQAFDLAESQRWIFANPFHRSVRISSTQRKAEHWDLREIAILRATARANAGDPKRAGKWARTDARIIEVLVGSGMRREEVLGLTRRHVDLKLGRVQVQRVCVETYERQGDLGKRTTVGGRLKDVPKTVAANRFIPLPAFALEALRSQLREISATRLVSEGNWNPEDVVFPDPETGRVMSPHAFSIRIGRLVKQAGISRAPGSAHGLRHSHAQALLEHGQTPVSTVTHRLGHSSEKVTLTTYLRSTSAMDEAAADDAESVFGPTPSGAGGAFDTADTDADTSLLRPLKNK